MPAPTVHLESGPVCGGERNWIRGMIVVVKTDVVLTVLDYKLDFFCLHVRLNLSALRYIQKEPRFYMQHFHRRSVIPQT